MLLGNASLNMARVAVWGRLSCLPAALNSMSWSYHELQFLGHFWPTVKPLASTRYLLVAGNASVILAHGDEVAQIKSGTNREGASMMGENGHDGHVFLHMGGALVGEGGALGIANKRSTQISAWKVRHGASRVTISQLHVIAALRGWNGSADQVARSIDWEGVMAELERR